MKNYYSQNWNFKYNVCVIHKNENNLSDISDKIKKNYELDNDDNKYLEFINRPIFTDIDYWNNHYTIEVIANNINKLI